MTCHPSKADPDGRREFLREHLFTLPTIRPLVPVNTTAFAGAIVWSFRYESVLEALWPLGGEIPFGCRRGHVASGRALFVQPTADQREAQFSLQFFFLEGFWFGHRERPIADQRDSGGGGLRRTFAIVIWRRIRRAAAEIGYKIGYTYSSALQTMAYFGALGFPPNR